MLSPPSGLPSFSPPRSTNASIIRFAAAVEIVPADPARVALIVGLASGSGFIFPGEGASATNGIAQSQQSKSLILTWKDYGPLINGKWSGFSNSLGGGTGLSVSVDIRDKRVAEKYLMPPYGITQFRAPKVTVKTGFTTPVQLCSADPSRVVLILAVTSGTPVVGIGSGVLTTNGITLGTTVPPLIFNWADHCVLCNQEWWGTAGAAATMVIIEVSYQPTPVDQEPGESVVDGAGVFNASAIRQRLIQIMGGP